MKEVYDEKSKLFEVTDDLNEYTKTMTRITNKITSVAY